LDCCGGSAVGRCNLKGLKTRIESAELQRLKLICDELFTLFALNFNLRCYGASAAAATLAR